MNSKQKQLRPQLKRIFMLGESKESAICPPNQIFVNPNFNFLLTTGGNLAEGEKEYENLMILLQEIGEKEFYIFENIGATLPSTDETFFAKIPTNSDSKYFDQLVKSYKPPFGFATNNFFIFGQNQNWGIYICECPTINIIGCIPEFEEKFRKAFNIGGNGYSKLKSLIREEFLNRKDLIEKFVENYRLEK